MQIGSLKCEFSPCNLSNKQISFKETLIQLDGSMHIENKHNFWVFGYGSLMWRPGFPYLDSSAAILKNYARSFCVYSRHHRGTQERPGLVLGLDPVTDAECHGQAFKIAPDTVEETVAYLNERELCGYAYIPATVPVILTSGEEVSCYTFVADPSHPYYAGKLPLAQAAHTIMQATGLSGLNRDYLINSVRELEAHGYIEPELHDLLKEVEFLTGELEAGGGI